MDHDGVWDVFITGWSSIQLLEDSCNPKVVWHDAQTTASSTWADIDKAFEHLRQGETRIWLRK